ncbi:MAG TPA: hypothetical protein QGH10_24150, partial [Armatimonadota bacterium]|nr:hypothetical protein [Armatimonadota bacterium]
MPSSRTRSMHAALAALSLLALVAHGAAQDDSGDIAPVYELLSNGSFETTDNTGSPVSWRAEWADLPGVGIGLSKGQRSRTGTKGLRLRSETSPASIMCFNGPIDFSSVAGKDIILSCFHQTVGEPGGEIQLVTYAESFVEAEGRSPFLSSERHPLAPTKDWRMLSWRLHCPEDTVDAVLYVQIGQEGELGIDDISIRPVETPIHMEPIRLGEMVKAPSRREVSVRIVNGSAEDKVLKFSAGGGQGKQKIRKSITVKLDAGASDEVSVAYNIGPADPHLLELSLEDAEIPAVYDTLTVDVEPLLSGDVISPAFRGTVMSSVPVDEIVVEGRINAPDEIAASLQLVADLGGAGIIARDGEGITRPRGPRSWRVVIPREGLLTGRYTLAISASDGKRSIAAATF